MLRGTNMASSGKKKEVTMAGEQGESIMQCSQRNCEDWRLSWVLEIIVRMFAFYSK